MSPLKIGLVLFVLIGAVCGLLHKKLIRVYQVITLFYPGRIVENFRSMDAIFATAEIQRPPVAHSFPRAPAPLPATYTYQAEEKDLATWFEQNWTTGLVVIRDGAITFEEYYRGNGETSKAISSLNPKQKGLCPHHIYIYIYIYIINTFHGQAAGKQRKTMEKDCLGRIACVCLWLCGRVLSVPG